MPYSVDPQPGENELECARCGAIVYAELTRCPKCGVNLYEPADEAEDEVDSAPQNTDSPLASIRIFFRQLLGLAHPADELFATPQKQARLYNNLLRKVGGERATVDRLIDLERRRWPNANRLTWLENAIRRWERDNQ